MLARLFIPVRDVGALFTVNDPVMQKRIKKNLRTVRATPEFTMTFSSNSLGWRGPEPPSAPRDGIVFVGDSYTLGFGVNDGEEFPALIKARLDATYGMDAVSVVNAGIGDSGNGRWVKLLRTELPKYQPRLVVLQFMTNDFEDNLREGLYALSAAGELVERPVRTSRMKDLEPLLDSLGLSNSYLYGAARQALADRGMPKSAASARDTGEQVHEYAERLTEHLIEETLSLCRQNGYRVFAVLVGLEDDGLRQAQRVFRAHGVPELALPTKRERPDLYYRIDGHWNRAGHAFAAQAVYERLQALNLLPCPGCER